MGEQTNQEYNACHSAWCNWIPIAEMPSKGRRPLFETWEDWQLAWSAARAALGYECQQAASKEAVPAEAVCPSCRKTERETKRNAWVDEVANVRDLLGDLYLYQFNREGHDPDRSERCARAYAWLRTVLVVEAEEGDA